MSFVSAGRPFGLLLFASLLSCQNILGLRDLPTAQPELELGADCGACVHRSCEPEARACLADLDCAALAACATSHPSDPSGRSGCEAAASVAAQKSNYQALDACLRGPCQSTCFGSSGLLAGRGAACEVCLGVACQDQVQACLSSRRCEQAVVDAYTGPMTPPKNFTVDNAVGEQGAPMRALDDCLQACASDCKVDGGDFSCAGNYAWPKPALASATLEVEVSELDVAAHFTAEPGVNVKACAPRSNPCEATGEATTTGPLAIATLELTLPKPEAYRGYLRIEDGPSSTDALFPTNLFIGHPIYGDLHGPVVVPTVEVADLLPGLAKAKAKRLPNRAQIQIAFLDCGGRLASGVVAEFPPQAFVDSQTIPYYPFANAPPTGTSGQAILFNAAPGCYEIVGTVGGVERYRFRLDAQADVLTTAYGFPESDPIDVAYICTPTGG